MQHQLNASMMLEAYRHGLFPMATDRQSEEILWVRPRERGIIPLDERFHISRSLQKQLRSSRWTCTIDQSFDEVIRHCATVPREGSSGKTWLSHRIETQMCDLHGLGVAHSLEVHDRDGLAGGLYGLAIGGVFVGESMFCLRPNASKVALVTLVERLRARGFALLDAQYDNPYLQQFGSYVISNEIYSALFAANCNKPVAFI